MNPAAWTWSCEVVQLCTGRKVVVHLTEENTHWCVVEANDVNS
jgi:hypothetical protein